MTPKEMAARIEVLEWRLERLAGIVTVLLDAIRDAENLPVAAQELRAIIQRDLAARDDD